MSARPPRDQQEEGGFRQRGGPRGGGGEGGGFRPRRRVCWFCSEGMDYIDYKNADLLGRYVQVRGKITPSRITGTCARHQRRLSDAVKRARLVAILPFVID
jgi:small subunit ribosomal protein S18